MFTGSTWLLLLGMTLPGATPPLPPLLSAGSTQTVIRACVHQITHVVVRDPTVFRRANQTILLFHPSGCCRHDPYSFHHGSNSPRHEPNCFFRGVNVFVVVASHIDVGIFVFFVGISRRVTGRAALRYICPAKKRRPYVHSKNARGGGTTSTGLCFSWPRRGEEDIKKNSQNTPSRGVW